MIVYACKEIMNASTKVTVIIKYMATYDYVIK